MEVNRLYPVKKNPKVQTFAPGDTVRVSVKVKEGERERVQAFQGVVMEIHGRVPATCFTVRRVTYGVGVERVFPIYSPILEAVEVIRRGDVRRANLSYLRGRTGRAARIKERAWTAPQAEEAPVEEAAVAEAAPPAAAAPAAPAAQTSAQPVAAAPKSTEPQAKASAPAEAAKPEPSKPEAATQPQAQPDTKQ